MRETRAPWKNGVVLVCNNQRPDGAAKPSCGRAQGQALKAWLKEAARAGGGEAAACRVLNTSCLDICPAHGVAVALMPGDDVVVVDPMDDRDALLRRVQAHMKQAAADTEHAGGKRGSGLLGKLRRR